MKYDICKKVSLNITVDSSEAVMFNQGGRHKVEIPSDMVSFVEPYILEVSMQLEKNQQYRHSFITTEAAAAIKRRENEESDSDE
jgi:hypothetical protein